APGARARRRVGDARRAAAPRAVDGVAGRGARARARAGAVGVTVVSLREVEPGDLPVLFEHQLDAEATEMAAFPSRDREAFDARWARGLANPTATARTIVADGQVAGNIGSFDLDGRRMVGYWIGREFWGRGVATQALAQLLAEEPARPVHAYV